MLTHGNIAANIESVVHGIHFDSNDHLLGVLPFFHSFGLVGGIVAPLVRGLYCFLYPSPLHYRIVPTLIYEKNCTVMLATTNCDLKIGWSYSVAIGDCTTFTFDQSASNIGLFAGTAM